MAKDLDIYEQHDRLCDGAGGPAVDWTYRHGDSTENVLIGLVPYWPELEVRVISHGSAIEFRGIFSSTGRLRHLELVARTDGAEITTADLRSPGVLRVLKEWEAVGRQVAIQILSGTPLDRTVFDARTPTEALRVINQANIRKRPRRRRQGGEHEELLRQVADSYREELEAGNRRPRKALAGRFGYTPEHIGALLVEARKPRNGQPPLLGPARPGKAGEEPDDG